MRVHKRQWWGFTANFCHSNAATIPALEIHRLPWVSSATQLVFVTVTKVKWSSMFTLDDRVVWGLKCWKHGQKLQLWLNFYVSKQIRNGCNPNSSLICSRSCIAYLWTWTEHITVLLGWLFHLDLASLPVLGDRISGIHPGAIFTLHPFAVCCIHVLVQIVLFLGSLATYTALVFIATQCVFVPVTKVKRSSMFTLDDCVVWGLKFWKGGQKLQLWLNFTKWIRNGRTVAALTPQWYVWDPVLRTYAVDISFK